MGNFKFLHIIRNELWNSQQVFSVLERNTNRESHAFLLINFDETEFRNVYKKNLFFVSRRLSRTEVAKCIKLFNAAEFVVWHGIFVNLKLLKACCRRKALFKKFVWISQGSDLYNWKAPTENLSFGEKIKNKRYNRYGAKFRESILYFSSLFPRDCLYYEKCVNKHGRTYDVGYLDGEWADVIKRARKSIGYAKCDPKVNKKSLTAPKPSNKPVIFLVGVSSSQLNRHTEILNSLVNLKSENIVISIPLWTQTSNNDLAYAKKTIAYAGKLFGKEKVVAKRVNSWKEYVNFVKQADVVINRTTVGIPAYDGIYYNILTALALGKTVFLYPDSPLSRFMTSQGVYVQDAKKIFGMTMSDFRKTISENAKMRFAYVDKFVEEASGFRQFNRLFEALSFEHKHTEFLHVIRPSVELSSPFVEIVDSYFDTQKHNFLMNRRVPFGVCAKFRNYPNIKLRLLGNTKLARILYMKECLDKCDHIVWHGFYAGYGKPILDIKELLLIAFSPKYVKKMTWVGWGADLYDWKADLSYFKGVKKIIVRYINKLGEKTRRKIPNFVTLFPPDADKYRAQFGDNATIYDGTYSNLHFEKLIEDARPEKVKSPNAPLDIMVGHSANIWNNHIEVLNALAQYRDKNVRIIIPLSTGVTMGYKNRVMETATRLFGKKAVFITKKMPIKNYLKFLWTVDVAVFNIERQAAIGNLMNLFYMGKKVFLPSNTIMYDFFNSQGVKVYDTKQLDSMPFDEFKLVENNEKPDYILGRTDPEKIVEKWRVIFDGISKTK